MANWNKVSAGDLLAALQALLVAWGNEASEIVEALKGDPALAQKSADQIRALLADWEAIRVDRSALIIGYPHGVPEFKDFHLQNIGPVEYRISELKPWVPGSQFSRGSVNFEEVYLHLKLTGSITTALGLADLVEIQKRGIAFFLKHFRGLEVHGWRSVVQDSTGHTSVPYLRGVGEEVKLSWLPTNCLYGTDTPIWFLPTSETVVVES